VTWAGDWAQGGQLPVEDQLEGIQVGALWPYVRQAKLYKCPTGFRGELMTYAMMISSNGRAVDDKSPQFKKRLRIPRPAERLIFIDEGLSSPDAYATRYVAPTWWDQPVTRHGDGTNFAFADGHADYHKWTALETIQLGRNHERTWVGNFAPTTPEGEEDLEWVQLGIWGKLGYKK
jgi:prepilin-type processing-associated H-X9-DG protein